MKNLKLRSRLAIVSSTDLGQMCLEKAARFSEVEIVGVISGERQIHKATTHGPMSNVSYVDFEALCRQGRYNHCHSRDLVSTKSWHEVLSRWAPDFILVAGWYDLIPESLVSEFSFVGLHASLLPSYRGWSPMVWALLNGEEKTGMSLFQFDSGLDTGPLFAQREFPIGARTRISDLKDVSNRVASEILEEFLMAMSAGTVRFNAQEDSDSRPWPVRTPADAEIDASYSAEWVDRLIRAQSEPYAGAFLKTGEGKIVIWEAEIVEAERPSGVNPGEIFTLDDSNYLACSPGNLRLLRFERDF